MQLCNDFFDSYKKKYDKKFKRGRQKKFEHKQFKINSDENNKLELAKLPKWLKSRNDFNEARKLINNIRANTNNVKGSSNYKKLFNNLNRLRTDISNNKVNEEKVIKRMKKVYLI